MYRTDGFTKLIGLIMSLAVIATCVFAIKQTTSDLSKKFDEDAAIWDAVQAQKELDGNTYPITDKKVSIVGFFGKETRYRIYYDVPYTLNGEPGVYSTYVDVTQPIFDSVSVGDMFNVASLQPVETTVAETTAETSA